MRVYLKETKMIDKELPEKIAGQNTDLIIKWLKEIFKSEGDNAGLIIKNNLARSFFKMVMNDEESNDQIRDMARTYFQLYEFFSNFDEHYLK